MSKEKTKTMVPKLRFPEFREAGEWKEKPLGKICEVNPSVDKLPEEFVYIDLESVESGILLQKKIISLKDAPSRAQRLLKNGDVIFQTVRPYQQNNYFFQLEDGFDYVASTGYAQLRAYQSNAYLFQYLHNGNFVNRVLAKCTGSNYPAINSSDLAEIIVEIPTPPEQQKIAATLSSLDELIAAQSEKIKALQAHKKGLMQRLFPAEGETVPRMRFGEFQYAGEWEVKPFNKVFTRIKTKNIENNQNVLTISAQKGLVSQLDYFNKSIAAKDLSGYYLLQKGDFAYNKSYSQGYPMGAIKPLKNYDKGVVSTLYICFKANKGFTESFFEYYFDAGMLNSEVGKIAQEGARNHGLLNIGINEFFSEINLLIPRNSDEQLKIASCLSSLDDLIAAQSEKLEALKVHKRGLMQQLFPNPNEMEV